MSIPNILESEWRNINSHKLPKLNLSGESEKIKSEKIRIV
jgi:hypothetical protein